MPSRARPLMPRSIPAKVDDPRSVRRRAAPTGATYGRAGATYGRGSSTAVKAIFGDSDSESS